MSRMLKLDEMKARITALVTYRAAMEIRINLDDGWFRVMYVAKFSEAVYVLHCFNLDSSVC